jgi:hypothetical protein
MCHLDDASLKDAVASALADRVSINTLVPGDNNIVMEFNIIVKSFKKKCRAATYPCL